MSKISKISQSARQDLLKRHVLQLKLASIFEKKMYRERMKAFTRFKNKAEKMSIDQLVDSVQWLYNENTDNILKSLYMLEAKILGETVFTQKSDATWWQNVIKWIETYTGEKIVIIEGTAKKELQKELNNILSEDIVEHGGIEPTTREVLQKTKSIWKEAQLWQVRRIIQTEAMEAGAVGSIEAVNSLNIPYEKIWACSFRNSREDHILMDGVTVGQDEIFNLPNGDRMKFAHDPTLGAGPENLINCSCDTLYEPV